MIDEERFQHRLAHLLRRGRIRINLHARRNGRGAGDGPARRARLVGQHGLRNLRRAVLVEHRLAVRAHLRRAEFDEAHAAVAGDGELRVVAIVRHLMRRELTGLKHRGRLHLALPVGHHLRHLDFAAVHLDFDFVRRRRRGRRSGGRGGLGFSCRGGGHGNQCLAAAALASSAAPFASKSSLNFFT